MENEIKIDHQVFSEANLNDIALEISGWTKEAGTMLPKAPGEIKDLLLHGTTSLIWHEGRDAGPAAFGAVTFEWPGNWLELGAIVVDKKFRQQGVGHLVVGNLIKAAKAMHPDANLFALCNEKSLKLFLDNGAEIITDPNLLPNEVFGECVVSCPHFQEAKSQGKICCDTPVIIR
jgi:GNAT superfamily N-acetyltransferase